MRDARHRSLSILAALATLAVLTAGCGSSEEASSRTSGRQDRAATETAPPAPPGASARSCEGTVAGTGKLRVTGIGCDVGRGVVAAWAGRPSCAPHREASRSACSVYDGYRCLGAATERGLAVSCARPGSSAAFVSRRDGVTAIVKSRR